MLSHLLGSREDKFVTNYHSKMNQLQYDLLEYNFIHFLV